MCPQWDYRCRFNKVLQQTCFFIFSTLTTDHIHFTFGLTSLQFMCRVLQMWIHSIYPAIPDTHWFPFLKRSMKICNERADSWNLSCVIHHREHQICIHFVKVTLSLWGNPVQPFWNDLHLKLHYHATIMEHCHKINKDLMFMVMDCTIQASFMSL